MVNVKNQIIAESRARVEGLQSASLRLMNVKTKNKLFLARFAKTYLFLFIKDKCITNSHKKFFS